MINAKLNDRVFDAMLQTACEDLFEERLAAFDTIAAKEEKPEFSPEFERKMKKLLRGQSRKVRAKTAKKALRRAAVIILAIMAVGFTVTMSVEAIRVQFFNTIIDFAGEYIGFTFQDKYEQQPVTDAILRPSYIPEGYREGDVTNTPMGVYIIYEKDDGEIICFSQLIKSEGLSARIDGDHSYPPYNISINGISVQVIESNTEGHDSYVIWENNIHFYTISGTVPPAELIEMARSVITAPSLGSIAPPTDNVQRPKYIPEGYWEDDVLTTLMGVRITYANDNGDTIMFSQLNKNEGLSVRIDGEHSHPPYNQTINGVSVKVIESNTGGHDNYVIWEDNNVFFRLAGTVQPSELIEMARSILE